MSSTFKCVVCFPACESCRHCHKAISAAYGYSLSCEWCSFFLLLWANGNFQVWKVFNPSRKILLWYHTVLLKGFEIGITEKRKIKCLERSSSFLSPMTRRDKWRTQGTTEGWVPCLCTQGGKEAGLYNFEKTFKTGYVLALEFSSLVCTAVLCEVSVRQLCLFASCSTKIMDTPALKKKVKTLPPEKFCTRKLVFLELPKLIVYNPKEMQCFVAFKQETHSDANRLWFWTEVSLISGFPPILNRKRTGKTYRGLWRVEKTFPPVNIFFPVKVEILMQRNIVKVCTG